MNETRDRILIVDDESSIRRTLRTTLTAMGFTTADEATGERAIEHLGYESFDAVLLDVNMPGMGGIATCRLLRRQYPQLGILMLTVRDRQDDKVEALEAGADDYVVKPFQLRELAARLRAVIRRLRSATAPVGPDIRIGILELNVERRLLTRNGEPVHLTPKEFELLHYLMTHAGIPVPHARLLQAVWGPEYGGESEYLRTFIRQIRKKIEPNAAEPEYLITDHYVGYRFRAMGE